MALVYNIINFKTLSLYSSKKETGAYIFERELSCRQLQNKQTETNDLAIKSSGRACEIINLYIFSFRLTCVYILKGINAFLDIAQSGQKNCA